MMKCPVCANCSRLVTDDLVGYRDDLSFTIMECCCCGLSYASPLASDGTIYEWIYMNMDRVPGYSRYQSYFDGVRKQPNPLAYLSSQESGYWACAEYVKQAKERFRGKPKVLEIGCGAGYLTYALRKSGYDVGGADISNSAIMKAKSAFGDRYRQMDVLAQTLATDERYDILIMMEVIEHVTDPLAFLAAAKRLLAPNGEIFITTPNKQAARNAFIWDTDLPPVHLYWFTTRSLQALATRLGATICFSDFTKFHKTRHILKTQGPLCNSSPTFSRDGRLLIRPPTRRSEPARASQWSRAMAARLGIADLYRQLRDKATGQERWKGPDGLTLAAWFKFC